jgi:hypothetical protein
MFHVKHVRSWLARRLRRAAHRVDAKAQLDAVVAKGARR